MHTNNNKIKGRDAKKEKRRKEEVYNEERTKKNVLGRMEKLIDGFGVAH